MITADSNTSGPGEVWSKCWLQLADRCWGLNRGQTEEEISSASPTTFFFVLFCFLHHSLFLLWLYSPLCNYTSCLQLMPVSSPSVPASSVTSFISSSLLAKFFECSLSSLTAVAVFPPKLSCTCQVTTPLGPHRGLGCSLDLNVICFVWSGRWRRRRSYVFKCGWNEVLTTRCRQRKPTPALNSCSRNTFNQWFSKYGTCTTCGTLGPSSGRRQNLKSESILFFNCLGKDGMLVLNINNYI